MLYFVHLGTVGFGGPIALAARMEKDLVETRRWISREDYLEGLAFSQLSPGPLAAQLAMYIGWLKAGRAGAVVVSMAFVLPSFLMAVAVAAAYVSFGQLAWIQSLFYGIGAAVIAIIAQGAWRLARRTIGRDLFLWLLFTVVAVPYGRARKSFGYSCSAASLRSCGVDGLAYLLHPRSAHFLARQAGFLPAYMAPRQQARSEALRSFSERQGRSCSVVVWRSCLFFTAAWLRSSTG
jgi:chromate transport protein ChrA